MMARYVIGRQVKACGWVENDYRVEDGQPLIPGCDVDDRKEVDTGLIAPGGAPIMRLSDPIGFGREGER
jgi:hypothetical protein